MDDGGVPSALPRPTWGQTRSSNRLVVPVASLQPFLSSIVVNNPLVAKTADSPSLKSTSQYSVCGEGGYDADALSLWPPPLTPPKTPAQHAVTFFISRLRILVLALPLAGLVILIRYLNVIDYGIEIPVEAVVLPPLITAAVFVMATVLSNVMADYKESEKLPAELVSYFNTLVIWARAECATYGFDDLPMLLNVEDMLLCVIATLDGKVEFSRGLATFHESFLAYCVYAHGQSRLHDNHIGDLDGPEHATEEIVKKWTRIHDIGRLSIILPGYTLMDLITVLSIALLCSVTYKDIPGSANWAIFIFATILIYLNILVRALDDPFDGPDNFHFRCYTHCAYQPMSFAEAFHFGLGIDFECLTVNFGSILRRLIHEHDQLPAPGSQARGNGISEEGHIVARPSAHSTRNMNAQNLTGGVGTPIRGTHATYNEVTEHGADAELIAPLRHVTNTNRHG